MKQGIFEIKSNIALTSTVYKMELAGDTSAITGPGQFVNILLEGFYLRRPISVNDCVGDTLTICHSAFLLCKVSVYGIHRERRCTSPRRTSLT